MMRSPLRRQRRLCGGLIAASLLLQGCAAPVRSVSQVVHVETPGCAQATCELSNDVGRWNLSATPGEVTLSTSLAPLQVSCKAQNGVVASTGVNGTTTPMKGGSAAVGGIAGGAAVAATFGTAALAFIPVLGVIIVATGAAAGALAGKAAEASTKSWGYPEHITVALSCPLPTAESASWGWSPLGLGVSSLTDAPAIAGAGPRTGVLVTRVVADSSAAAAGLRVGDVILAVGGQLVQEPGDLEEKVRAQRSQGHLLLRVQRGAQTLDLTLTRQPAAT